MTKRHLLFITIVLAAAIAAGWTGRAVTFSHQWPFFEALRTTASIVLGIMGAWVSILYPKALDQIINGKESAISDEHQARIDTLLLPIKLSTFVLVAVLAIGPVSLLASQSALVVSHVNIVRGVSFGFLVLLSLAEMAAVVLTIWPADAARREVDAAKSKRKTKDSMLKLVDIR